MTMIGRSESARSRAQQFEAVLIAQLQIEDHQVDPARRQHTRHLPAIGGRADPEVLVDQVVGDHGAHRRIVVDGENVLHPTLPRISGTGGCAGHAAAMASISTSQASSKMPAMTTVRAVSRPPSTSLRTARFARA